MHGDTRGFFHERLMSALQRRGVAAAAETELYLLDLLIRGTQFVLATPDQPLVHRLAAALAVDEPRARRERLREAGDSALYTAGFFGEHVQSRGMSVRYYAEMGGRAYRGASDLPGPHVRTFRELAGGFTGFTEVLDEVRESTQLRTPQDIVRLYDRWKRTGNPRLAERLQEEGVFPTVADEGTLH